MHIISIMIQPHGRSTIYFEQKKTLTDGLFYFYFAVRYFISIFCVCVCVKICLCMIKHDTLIQKKLQLS